MAVTLDAAGNVTADGTYRYVWDALNQLRELRTPGNALIASYFYDHRQLRSRKVTTAVAPQGVSTTFYHYDQQGRLIGESASSSVPLRTYVWNGDTLTGLIVHQPQRSVYTVQVDHLGSPFQVRSLEGKVLWRWESEAFGKTAPNEDVDGDTQKLILNLRFPGQYYDRESGLHYNWHRYYSPKLARYLSPDPIGLEGGGNEFAYVGGNPLKRTDPTGEFALEAPVLIGAGVGLIIMSSPQGRQNVSSAVSSIADTASAAVDKIKAMCKPNNDDECEKKRDFEEGMCEGLAIQWGKQGVAVCKKSARIRYAECLRFGPGGVTTPLHGVDTPL